MIVIETPTQINIVSPAAISIGLGSRLKLKRLLRYEKVTKNKNTKARNIWLLIIKNVFIIKNIVYFFQPFSLT